MRRNWKMVNICITYFSPVICHPNPLWHGFSQNPCNLIPICRGIHQSTVNDAKDLDVGVSLYKIKPYLLRDILVLYFSYDNGLFLFDLLLMSSTSIGISSVITLQLWHRHATGPPPYLLRQPSYSIFSIYASKSVEPPHSYQNTSQARKHDGRSLLNRFQNRSVFSRLTQNSLCILTTLFHSQHSSNGTIVIAHGHHMWCPTCLEYHCQWGYS